MFTECAFRTSLLVHAIMKNPSADFSTIIIRKNMSGIHISRKAGQSLYIYLYRRSTKYNHVLSVQITRTYIII